MEKRVRFAAVFVMAFMGLQPLRTSAQQLTRYVDPFIGTGGHGHTYPGATVPFGMVQLSPDNGDEGWDWCSGYHYSSDSIAGFSHTHLSGTGIGDWCDISVLPNNGLIPDSIARYKVAFTHQAEKATPGFYEVALNNGIQAAFTTTERCGLHQYTFPTGSTPVIRFDLGFAINWDRPTETFMKQLNDTTFVGYRFSTGWAQTQRVYFAARTSAPVKELYLNEGLKKLEATEATGKSLKAQLVFENTGEPVLMKVGLSSVNTNKALLALDEIPTWAFEKVRADAEIKWEKELQKITVKSSNEESKKIFYTALYHTCLAPVLYSDADGTYQNAKGQIAKMDGGQRYTVFSLWDTFRALNPLLTITQSQRYSDMLNTMLRFYD
ncbi:MAG TPA: GH92 family glycosyl hydrolase, partial [Chitinophagaceae bacterium]|nr:GH92 family glycosyl hydrolase [Chitinophagaceae bacterium]